MENSVRPDPHTDHSKHHHRTVSSFEAKANRHRSTTDKIADVITKRAGSMSFLFLNLLWFGIWITINSGVTGITPFDPFPFGFLTMVVSLEAIFLAIIVLISQNRASKISDLREETDLQINKISEEEITKIIELQVMLLEKQGVDLSQDEDLKEMLKPMDTMRIERSLEKQAGENEVSLHGELRHVMAKRPTLPHLKK